MRLSQVERLELTGELFEEREAERVARLGPIDGHQRHAVMPPDRGIDSDHAGGRLDVGHADSLRVAGFSAGQVSMFREGPRDRSLCAAPAHGTSSVPTNRRTPPPPRFERAPSPDDGQAPDSEHSSVVWNATGADSWLKSEDYRLAQ